MKTKGQGKTFEKEIFSIIKYLKKKAFYSI